MQQHHYTAADMTGDETFPSHLTSDEAARMLAAHDFGQYHTQFEEDGSLIVRFFVWKDGKRAQESKLFSPTRDGLFRAAPILLFLGY